MGARTRDGDTTAMQPAAQMNAREKGEEPKRRSSSGSSGGPNEAKMAVAAPTRTGEPQHRDPHRLDRSAGPCMEACQPGAASARDSRVISKTGTIHPMGCGVGHGPGPGPRAWPPDWPDPLANACPPRPDSQPGCQRSPEEISMRNVSKGECPLFGVFPYNSRASLLDPGLVTQARPVTAWDLKVVGPSSESWQDPPMNQNCREVPHAVA